MRIGLDARLASQGLGIGTMIGALARGLTQAGCEVVWFGEPAGAPSEIAEAHRPPGPGFAGLDSPRGKRLVSRARVDLMHFPANTGWWSRGPVPSVLTVHDLIWASPSRAGRRPRQVVGHAYLRVAVPRSLRAADAVLSISDVTAAALWDHYGVRCEVIHHGVSDQWRNARPDPARDSPYVIAFAGRDPRKGTEITLAAWESLAVPGLRLVLLSGGGVSPALLPRLDAASSEGLIELLGYQPIERLTELVAGALALIYPSRDEGFGLPVIEAMAAGVPVITGLAPVTLEVGGDAVLRLDRHDPVASAVAHLRALLDDPALRAAQADAGRRHAAQFTWERSAERHLRAYARVLDASRQFRRL
ncbi:MAG: glycosyltransferase family 4 protein [Solirubrobacteraceae bacterium]